MRIPFHIVLLSIALVFIAIAMYLTGHTPKTHHKITYLALGDSYTSGYKVRYADNYANQATDLLRGQQLDVADPKIIAYPGWTTVDLEKGIALANVTDTFSFVTLLIGTNDLSRGWTTETYRVNFERLLNRAILFAGGHADKVFVLSLPDASLAHGMNEMSRAVIGKGIKDYNAANKEITLAHNCRYIDITDALGSYAEDASYYIADWEHPTAKGYAVWTGIMVPVIAGVLQEQGGY